MLQCRKIHGKPNYWTGNDTNIIRKGIHEDRLKTLEVVSGCESFFNDFLERIYNVASPYYKYSFSIIVWSLKK